MTNDPSDPVNLIGKIVLNAAACLALVLLAGKSAGGEPQLRNDHRVLLNN